MKVEEGDEFDDSEAHEEMDMMITVTENLDDPEDSLRNDDDDNEFDYLGGMDNENFEEQICRELKEMWVLEIEPSESRNWMNIGLGGEVRMKPRVENYARGTWMLSDWVVNKINNSTTTKVGHGKIMFCQCVQTSWGVNV